MNKFEQIKTTPFEPFQKKKEKPMKQFVSLEITNFYPIKISTITFTCINFYSEVSKHYNAKVSLEHQLPTATQRLKTTDECVVSSLISLVTCTGKV